MFPKKLSLFIFFLLIISCENTSNFKISNMQENEDGATYTGQEWKGNHHSQNTDFRSLEDVNSAFTKTLKIIDVDNSFQFTPSTSWNYQNNSNAVNSQYAYTNGYPVDKINNKNISNNANIIYTEGASAWQFYSSGSQNYDYNHGTPILIENTDSNVTYTGTWYEYGSYHYTHSSDAYLEYTFSGTNANIKMVKWYNRGKARIEIYKQTDLNNPVETHEVDNYSSNLEYITYKYHALKADDYLVRIKGAINKNINSTGYVVDFDFSKTFPAIQ